MFERVMEMFGARSGVKETHRIGIKGMTCKRCERTIKKALLTKSGVKQVFVNREEGIATVTFDPAKTNVPALHQVILRKGYTPQAVEE